MAKKPAKPMDAHTRRIVHSDITEKAEAMIVRCAWLRDQGRTDEARRLLKRIEQLSKELKGLEKP